MADMRILVVSNLYPPQELGGYGRSLADFVWGLQQRGHRVTVLSSDAPYLGPSAEGPNGEPVLRQLLLKGSFAGGVTTNPNPAACAAIDQHNSQVVRKQLAAEGFDGILLGNLDLLGAELLPVLLERGVPVLHHAGFMTLPYAIEHWPRARNYQLVAASAAVRQSLYQQGLPVATAPVVYPGARVELFGPEVTGRSLPAAAGLGTTTNPLKLAFAGLLMGSKGAHTLVQAACRLHQAGVRVQVNLAGAAFQQGYWQRLEAVAAQAGLDGLVRWVGNLERPQLARFLGLHHAGVFPSIFPEAFGIVGAEIQASGLALVSSGVGGAAELLEHGISGLRFKPNDIDDLSQQLLRLVQEPGLLGQLQETGRRQVRARFSVTTAAIQLEELWLNASAQQASNNAAKRGSITF